MGDKNVRHVLRSLSWEPLAVKQQNSHSSSTPQQTSQCDVTKSNLCPRDKHTWPGR